MAAQRILVFFAFAALIGGGALAQSPTDPDISVRLRIDSGTVTVDVEFVVRATPEEAWAVMTDFDNATRFIDKLHESRVVSRTTDILVVSQKGTMGLGPFSVPLESLSEVRLRPFEQIQSRILTGTMKKYDSDASLRRESEGTRVTYRVESVPDVWIPPLIGPAMIEYETRSRFRQLIEEILRRKAGRPMAK